MLAAMMSVRKSSAMFPPIISTAAMNRTKFRLNRLKNKQMRLMDFAALIRPHPKPLSNGEGLMDFAAFIRL